MGMILSRRGGGLGLRGIVEVQGVICGCVAPSSGLPSLRGRLVSAWQLGGRRLGPSWGSQYIHQS